MCVCVFLPTICHTAVCARERLWNVVCARGVRTRDKENAYRAHQQNTCIYHITSRISLV